MTEHHSGGSTATPATLAATADDAVYHPAHYKSGGMEAIDVIEAFKLGFNLGNTVKYVLRAGKKGAWSAGVRMEVSRREKAIEDLKKARFYLDRHITNLEAQE